MKIILVDDEKSMLLILKKMLSKIPDVEVIGSFQSTGEAYKFIKENKTDLAFVDINMPEESGLDFAKRITAEVSGTSIVFLTAHKEYALEAFEVYAFDYIVKPILQERLESTIKMAIRRFKSSLVNEEEDTITKLSFFGLGDLNIKSVNGEIVKLNSSKSFELLAYLLLNKGKYVSKWSVMDDIFRGMPQQNAEVYLNTTVYKLRKALEPYGMKETIISINEKYMINIQDFYTDFIDFENKVNTFHDINDANLETALKTEKLFVGELFRDKDYYWSMPEKERLSDIYWTFAKKLGIYLLNSNTLLSALQIFKKLVLINELDEEANCLLMRVYFERKDRISLIKQFERYTNVLETELEVSPSKMVTDLYVQLRNSLE